MTDNAALIRWQKREDKNVGLYEKFRPKKGFLDWLCGPEMLQENVIPKPFLSDFKTILDSAKNMEFYTTLGFPSNLIT